MSIGITILYALIFAALIGTCYHQPYQKYHPAVKFLNSLGFIFAAVYAGVVSGHTTFMLQMLPGFMLCLLGDVLLAFEDVRKSEKLFLGGLISFLTAHIAFLIVLCRISGVTWLDFVFPVLMVGIAFGLTKMENMDTKGMRLPVIVYAFFVSMLFSKAVLMGVAGGFGTREILLSAGAFLFLLSDLLLLFICFYQKKVYLNRFFNLFTYYTGLLLLAFSILY